MQFQRLPFIINECQKDQEILKLHANLSITALYGSSIYLSHQSLRAHMHFCIAVKHGKKYCNQGHLISIMGPYQPAIMNAPTPNN